MYRLPMNRDWAEWSEDTVGQEDLPIVFFHIIQKRLQTNITNIEHSFCILFSATKQISISIWPPFAFIVMETTWHERRTVSAVSFDHDFIKAFFKAVTLLWDPLQTSLSRTDQIVKSVGLMSGLDGGHMFLSQKPGKCCLHQACVTLDVWAGAPSCVNHVRFQTHWYTMATLFLQAFEGRPGFSLSHPPEWRPKETLSHQMQQQPTPWLQLASDDGNEFCRLRVGAVNYEQKPCHSGNWPLPERWRSSHQTKPGLCLRHSGSPAASFSPSSRFYVEAAEISCVAFLVLSVWDPVWQFFSVKLLRCSLPLLLPSCSCEDSFGLSSAPPQQPFWSGLNVFFQGLACWWSCQSPCIVSWHCRRSYHKHSPSSWFALLSVQPPSRPQSGHAYPSMPYSTLIRSKQMNSGTSKVPPFERNYPKF